MFTVIYWPNPFFHKARFWWWNRKKSHIPEPIFDEIVDEILLVCNPLKYSLSFLNDFYLVNSHENSYMNLIDRNLNALFLIGFFCDKKSCALPEYWLRSHIRCDTKEWIALVTIYLFIFSLMIIYSSSFNFSVYFMCEVKINVL